MVHYWSLRIKRKKREWDKEIKNYMATGSNSKTEKEAVEDGFYFILEDLKNIGDVTEKELKKLEKMNLKEKKDFIRSFGIIPEKHEGKLKGGW